MNKQATPQTSYIFSAELSELSAERNRKRTARIEAILTAWNVPYTKVIGSYKGALENSFKVNAKHVHPLFLNRLIFGEFDQESVLRIDGENRTGKLIFFSSESVELGTLASTGIQRAINELEAFTIYGGKAWYFKS